MSIETRGSIWVCCCCCQVASIFLEAKTGPRPAPKKMLDWHAIGGRGTVLGLGRAATTKSHLRDVISALASAPKIGHFLFHPNIQYINYSLTPSSCSSLLSMPSASPALTPQLPPTATPNPPAKHQKTTTDALPTVTA
jgi:hypothetical protein